MVLLAIDFQSLTTTLESVRDEMISGSLDNFIGIARLIGGLGALFYIAYRVWGSLARAEPIDVFPLLKPFAIGLLIINFSWVTGFLDVVISPIKAATTAMVSSGYDEVTKSRENRNRVREAKLREEGKAYVVDDAVYQEKMDKLDFWQSEFWSVQKEKAMYDLQKTAEDLLHTILYYLVEAAKLVLKVVSTFFIIMLSILGPLVFGFACFDGFGHGIPAWISRYISISLWGPVTDVLCSMLNKIEVSMNNIDIAVMNGADSSGSQWFFIVFYIISLVAFTTVPTVAGWIVEAGSGSGALGNRLAGIGAAAGGFAGSVVGKGMGMAGGVTAGLFGLPKFTSRGLGESMRNLFRGRSGGDTLPQG